MYCASQCSRVSLGRGTLHRNGRLPSRSLAAQCEQTAVAALSAAARRAPGGCSRQQSCLCSLAVVDMAFLSYPSVALHRFSMLTTQTYHVQPGFQPCKLEASALLGHRRLHKAALHAHSTLSKQHEQADPSMQNP